jgi:hypothetical protein
MYYISVIETRFGEEFFEADHCALENIAVFCNLGNAQSLTGLAEQHVVLVVQVAALA